MRRTGADGMQMDWAAVALAGGVAGAVVAGWARWAGWRAGPGAGLAIALGVLVTASFLGHLVAHFDPTPGRTLMITAGSALAFMAPALALRELAGPDGDARRLLGQVAAWTLALGAMGAVLAAFG